MGWLGIGWGRPMAHGAVSIGVLGSIRWTNHLSLDGACQMDRVGPMD